MPQEAEPDTTWAANMVPATQLILQDAQAEQISEALRDPSEKLENAIAEHRCKAGKSNATVHGSGA